MKHNFFPVLAAAGWFAASSFSGFVYAATDPSIGFPVVLRCPEGGKSDVLRIDLGAASAGGYAVFDVSGVKGRPVLRLSYANHPDGLGEKGCFTRETRAKYMGPSVDIPALPGNLNRHELYTICRTGRFVAPLIQGQVRYVRMQLDTPGTEVTLSSFDLENAEVFRTGAFDGSFRCSDARLEKLWTASAWTCQLASFPNHDAWKCAGGFLLPRKLAKASGEGWRREPSPCDGLLHVEYEFDANPHFPEGRFEVLAGDRRTAVVQSGANEIREISVPVAAGEKFGLALEKESWPVIRRMWIADASGATRWQSRFGEPGGLDEWDFARTRPFVADGAKRDRLVWSGDLWWAERNIFYSFNPGDEPYMRGSLELLAFNQTPEGYIHACPHAETAAAPRKGDWGPFQSDEFAAWFVPVLYDYYLYSGDTATLRKLMPAATRLMEYLERHTSPDGLFNQRRETSKHAGRLTIGDTSKRAYMNILLWKCYADAATMARATGDETAASRYENRAASLAGTVRRKFWNAQGRFFTATDKSGSFGFEANALALATRFATPEEARTIAPRLKRTGHGKFQALAVRGLMEYGFMDRALAAIAAHKWFEILDPGWKGTLTTYECMNLNRKGWGDESHPDTALAGIFSQYILGVAPTAPGYAKFVFRPRPCAGVSSASGTVPTPRGPVAVSWHIAGRDLLAELEIPEGTAAELDLPACERISVDGSAGDNARMLKPGRHKLVLCGVSAARPDAIDADIDGKGACAIRFAASSSHEAPPSWSISNLSRAKRGAKGWSSKAHGKADAAEWIELDFGSLKSIERIDLYARDDGDSSGGRAGFPRSFVVEVCDGEGEWSKVKTFEHVDAPAPGEAFSIDFYTVIGYPKAGKVRIKALELGPPASDEPDVRRMQFKRIEVDVR